MTERRLFGEIALSNHMITAEQLAECLEHQENCDPCKVIGQIMLEKSYLRPQDINLILKIQRQGGGDGVKRKTSTMRSEAVKSIAELAIERGYATREEVEECIKVQKLSAANGRNVDIGEIMVRKKAITTAQLETLQTLQMGSEFPSIEGYRILGRLSKGGMGFIYKARQISMDRVIALKILESRLTRNETHVQRFLKEAQTVAKLNHENIVTGIDVGECAGHYYFAMEYVNGESVLDIIKREKTLSPALAINVVYQAAKALDYASKHRIIHRDIKPSNILINHRGCAKICDLGFAKIADQDLHLTMEGLTLGTPYYMSPEQAKGAPDLDAQTDIYSLGATLFHMVVGQVPFTGRTSSEVMKKHIREPLRFPEGSEERIGEPVVQLIGTMMEKDREKRFATHKQVLDVIRPMLSRSPDRSSLVHQRNEPTNEIILLILYHTRSGETRKEAQWVQEGAAAGGVEAQLVNIEEVNLDDVNEANGIIIGSPSFFGSAGIPVKDFFEKSERLLGQLEGKVGAAFISRENIGIGRDRALFDILAPMIYHGMLVKGDFNVLHKADAANESALKVYELNCRKLGERIAQILMSIDTTPAYQY